MTRAKEELHLTSARDYGGRSARKVSQFVLEALDLPRDAARPREGEGAGGYARHSRPAGRDRRASSRRRSAPTSCSSSATVRSTTTRPARSSTATCTSCACRSAATTRWCTGRRSTAWSSTTCAGGRPASTRRSRTSSRRTTASGGTRGSSRGGTRRRGRTPGGRRIERFWHEEEASGTRPTFIEREFGVSLRGPGGARAGSRPLGPRRRDRGRTGDRGLQVLRRPGARARRRAGHGEPPAPDLRAGLAGDVRAAPGAGRAAVPRVRRGRPPHADGGGRRDGARSAVRAAARGIRARRFAATPSYQACRYCAYSQICPYTASRGI